jgi:hypothetical protein
MVTLTMRHRGGDLHRQLKGLKTAWRKVRQQRAGRELWQQHVSASVMATEVTHSRANGWHPHIHAMVRSHFWGRSAREELFHLWSEAIVAQLGDDARPTSTRGVHWTAAFDSSVVPVHYLTKLGLEVTGTAKDGRGSTSRSHWQLAADAATGEVRDVKLWHEFTSGTKGTQAIRLDDRAAAAAERWLEEQRDAHTKIVDGQVVGGDAPEQRVREVELWPDEVAALRWGERAHPRLLDELLADAESTQDPGEALRRALARCMPARKLARDDE